MNNAQRQQQEGHNKAHDAVGTAEQLRCSDYFPGGGSGIAFGIQRVLAMCVSNVPPTTIVAGAERFGSNSPDVPNLLYFNCMSMLFAGVATLLQTITIRLVGTALPIVQGPSLPSCRS